MSLLESMERSTCSVALACAKKLMALTLHLFQTLQLIDVDFSAALTEMEEVRQTISAWRSGPEDWIGHDLAVYRKAETLCGMLDASIACPCSVSSQLYRASYDRTCTSEQFYRWPIWYPYLDSALKHINQMFGDKSAMPFKLCSLLQCFEICNKTFQEVYTFYRHVLTCDEDVIFQELKRFVVWRCLSE